MATSATKLRATDNGMALHQIGTISHRKMNETNVVVSMTHPSVDQVDAGTRSPTPDYGEPTSSRGRNKNKTPQVNEFDHTTHHMFLFLMSNQSFSPFLMTIYSLSCILKSYFLDWNILGGRKAFEIFKNIIFFRIK